jgi:protein-L-isoaspartate(D-aspartate) O-methyltransferase
MKRKALGCLVLLISLAAWSWGDSPDPYAGRREAMVETQIAARGVKDAQVLAAMRQVERHRFLPETLWNEAYEDHPVVFAQGQTISQPYVVALMSELLDLHPAPTKGGLHKRPRVLEVGTGSGYQAAVLVEMGAEVYTIEILPDLARDAAKRLAELGYAHAHVRTGDGYLGWPEEAPFDGIIVTCAPEKVPEPLARQLKEGGRMVIPVGAWPAQMLYVMAKQKGKLVQEPVIPVSFVPMTGQAQKGRHVP